MTNREKYAKDLEVIPIKDFMVKKDVTANFCFRIRCKDCIFHDKTCGIGKCGIDYIEEWLDQECEVE